MDQVELMIEERKADVYVEDGRKPIEELNAKFKELEDAGWSRQVICEQTLITDDRSEEKLPVNAFLSPVSGTDPAPSLWIIGGVHGEEPASPNAFVQKLETIKKLSESGIPVVFCPLMNPSAYRRDWRYFDEIRDYKLGHSVTDSEHLLPQVNNPEKPRLQQPGCETAGQITAWALNTSEKRPPLLVFDHHEDEIELYNPDSDLVDRNVTYSYANGDPDFLAPICKTITDTLQQMGFPVMNEGTTRFGEKVKDGFVVNSPDGSIDELLASDKYIQNGQVVTKTPAKAVFVIETTRDKDIPLERRMAAHEVVINLYQQVWQRMKE